MAKKRQYCPTCEGSGRPGLVRIVDPRLDELGIEGYEDCPACGDGGRSFLDVEDNNDGNSDKTQWGCRAV
jgi:hypothetical protein